MKRLKSRTSLVSQSENNKGTHPKDATLKQKKNTKLKMNKCKSLNQEIRLACVNIKNYSDTNTAAYIWMFTVFRVSKHSLDKQKWREKKIK